MSKDLFDFILQIVGILVAVLSFCIIARFDLRNRD